MKKKFFPFVAVTFYMVSAMAQVGIGTETPTEVLDIDGTLRIRNLPINGDTNAIHTTGENTASDTPTETFTATHMLVLDANGVIGAMDGLPSMSNTMTWNSGNANFPNVTLTELNNNDPDAMQFTFKSLSVAFIRPSGTGNSYQFYIKSPHANESYIADIRSMTTSSAPYYRDNDDIAQNTWTRIGGTVTYTLGTSWHINVWLASIDRIYRVTVMSISGTGNDNRTLTVNIQEL